MGRSIKKGIFVHPKLMKKIERVRQMQERNEKNIPPIKTWSRASMILPEMVGLTIHVHNAVSYTHLTLPTKA